MWTASYLSEGEILQEMEGGQNLHNLKQEPTADTYEPEKETKDDVNIFPWVSGKKEVSLTMAEVHFFFVFSWRWWEIQMEMLGGFRFVGLGFHSKGDI